jgi:hypothetical protein
VCSLQHLTRRGFGHWAQKAWGDDGGAGDGAPHHEHDDSARSFDLDEGEGLEPAVFFAADAAR